MLFNQILQAITRNRYSSAAAYERHLRTKLRRHRKNRDLAFADAIGAESLELFEAQGDGQVAVLKHHGLQDGMTIYDLGCGCGRTAQALQRASWQGRYIGADIVGGFVSELKRKCPGFEAHVHREPSIVADADSIDILFHWSVFTHISPEECFLYLQDIFRALRPGGKLVFSFLELTDSHHYAVFENRLGRLQRKRRLHLLDTFLHRDWVALWAEKLGFVELRFTDGQDYSAHPPMWQTVASMVKPTEARA
jgi:cyclopropane fatty-acyl-phospholipid synthase-like methyltransferase